QQFRQCLELKPDHFRARRALAELLAAQGRTDDARTELHSSEVTLAFQAGKALPDSRKQEIAQEYLDIGILYQSELMGDNAAAERLFGAALVMRPEWPAAHYHLGMSLGKQSRYSEAVPHLRVKT